MAEENDEIVVDLREVWAILKRRRGMIFSVAGAFLAIAAAFCLIRPTMYESEARVETQYMARQFFASRTVLEPIIEKHLAEDGKKLPKYDVWAKDNLKLSEPGGAKNAVHKPEEGEFVRVSVTDKSPERAQLILTEILAAGKKSLVDYKNEQLEVSIKAAENSISRANKQSDEAMKLFQGLGGATPESMAYSVVFGRLSEAQRRVVDTTEQLEALKVAQEKLDNVVRIIDKPSLPKEPMPQGRAKICAIALVLGIIVGCVSAVVKEKF